jgi:putative ABC transport system permease protein
MQELFGVSLTTIAIVLLVLFVAVAAAIGILAWRNRIMFKLGVRNIPKRPAQTVLIIFGLMLSTVIITAAFSTGDTIVYTIRSIAADALGNTDEIVSAGAPGSTPGSGYFDRSYFDQLRDGLSDDDKVDGLLPVVREEAPLIDISTELSAASVTLFAPGPEFAEYTRMTTTKGVDVSLDDLAPDEVYIDESTAEDLKAEPGDQLLLYAGAEPTSLKLAGVVKGASSGSFSFVIMPLERAQGIVGKDSQINAIYVSNKGGRVAGAKYSGKVEDSIKSLLEGTGLEVETVKKDTLDAADMAGTGITTMFVMFGLFSIAAGVLLIFLIFVMLAAARKSEMGMARAVGTKRNHLVQMFLFEGVVYDLGAAVVGVALGVLVTYAIAGIMARIVQEFSLKLAIHVEPRSLIVAFTLGMLVTFVTVAVSAWRVSRLNIVRAIRDIPEPVVEKLGRRWFVVGLVLIILGFLLGVIGMMSDQASALYLGVSMIVIGVALILRSRGAKERLVFSVAGTVLVAWSLMPTNWFQAIFGDDLKMGIEMFFLAGVMMVLGAVWVVSYNLDVILRFLVRVLGRLKSAAPVLRAALAYPMKNRFRTGLTIAMFSLVIFTIVFMSVVISANTAALSDAESIGGGYDIQASVSYSNPIADMNAAIASKEGLNPDSFESIAGISTVPLEIRQVGAVKQDWKQYVMSGTDNAFLDTNGFEFTLMASEYGGRRFESARDVWQALKETPGLAVISADAVPTKSSFGMSFGGGFMLEGLYQEDKAMDPVQVELREPFTGKETTLTIVGVLDAVSFNYGVYTSQQTIDQIWPVPVTTYLFKLKDGVDATETADALESAFRTNGMQAQSIEDMLHDATRISFTINSLLQGFMSLGLVVGIAALGVVSTRAVVERRHEIGILRAIGFKRSSVQAAFLLESSIVALLGILIGTVLALALSYQVLGDLKQEIEGLEFQIPWVQMLIIASVSWVASMLMTIIPAWQASKIYPAEALRYE